MSASYYLDLINIDNCDIVAGYDKHNFNYEIIKKTYQFELNETAKNEFIIQGSLYCIIECLNNLTTDKNYFEIKNFKIENIVKLQIKLLNSSDDDDGMFIPFEPIVLEQEQVEGENIDYQNCWKVISKLVNLKFLYIDGSASSKIKKLIELDESCFPSSLEFLYINYSYFTSPLHISNTNLKVLKIHSTHFNQTLSNLPITLESLFILSGLFNQSLDNLPSNLKHFILLAPSYKRDLDFLPSSLIYFAGLYFNTFIYPDSRYPHSLKYLPKSIQFIHLDDINFCNSFSEIKTDYPNAIITSYKNYYSHSGIYNHMLTQIYNNY